MTEVVGYFTDVTNPHIQKVGGTPRNMGDDFGDNVYTGRNRFVAGILCPYANFRLVWTPILGTWSASNGYLEKTIDTANDWIQTPSSVAYGTWQYKMILGATSATHLFQFWPCMTTSGSLKYGYYITITYESVKCDFRSYTAAGDALVIDNGWTPDANPHTVKLTRNSANSFELFLDGVSKGTGTNSDFTTSSYMGVRYRNDSVANRFDNLEVY